MAQSADTVMADAEVKKTSSLDSTFPVLFPTHPALFHSQAEFDDFITQEFRTHLVTNAADTKGSDRQLSTTDASFSEVSYDKIVKIMSVANITTDTSLPIPPATDGSTVSAPFMAALEAHGKAEVPVLINKMLTRNADVTFVSTTNVHLDLFNEMADGVHGPRLQALLEECWKQDPLQTLKIIFNTRSIHLGKGIKGTFYRAMGWLCHNHPLSFLNSLRWLTRPVIEVKKPSEDTPVMVEKEKSADDPTRFDVKDGVSHGYWKDVLNMLVLAVNGEFHATKQPRDTLNFTMKLKPKQREWNQMVSKEKRFDLKHNRHRNAVALFEKYGVYRAFHILVARLFAEQLTEDLRLLQTGSKAEKKRITLCGKWAPSLKKFHDKHTFIVSSIAEIMCPKEDFPGISEREEYLRHAREAYRKKISALREHLDILERKLTSKQYSKINYSTVPSVAMNKCSKIFAEKDEERFDKYLDDLADGKGKISGAILLPSTLISAVRNSGNNYFYAGNSIKDKIAQKVHQTQIKVVDAQWKTLVQRIRDSGTMENSIAVCDVSGSMGSPILPDKTTPMDSAIGLSLLIAEVSKPPFGGAFITFSAEPAFEKIDLSATLSEKVRAMEDSEWGMNTNFTAVFEDLILPMAREHKLKQEDMVKRIFVFSDMQFDAAQHGPLRWSTSFERIKKQYELYGYEMPELVFWNLAGDGRRGVMSKPVTSDEPGTALVSGYSQGMLKVFLEGSSFEDDDEEIVEKEVVDEDGDEVTVVERKKPKLDAVAVMKKAIGHDAYRMLEARD